MNPQLPVSVRVSHLFSAPPERVFDAWLTTEMLGRWMFGPEGRDEEIVRLVLDARVGGSFSFLVRRQGMDIDHVGEYLEIDRPRRLVFTWATADTLPDTSRVAVAIEPLETGCELTLTHQIPPMWADYRDRVEAGWGTMLVALGRLLESSSR